MANFEAFCRVISSSINLLFLKSDTMYREMWRPAVVSGCYFLTKLQLKFRDCFNKQLVIICQVLQQKIIRQNLNKYGPLQIWNPLMIKYILCLLQFIWKFFCLTVHQVDLELELMQYWNKWCWDERIMENGYQRTTKL